MNCPNCNSPVASNAKFCGVCGNALNTSGATGSSTEAPVPEGKVPNQVPAPTIATKKKPYLLIIIIAVVAVGYYAYNSYMSHLHNGKAESLIKERLGLPAPVTYAVQHGLIRFSRYDNFGLNQFNALAEKKIITIVNKGSQGYYDYYTNYQIDIDPSAEKYKLRDSSDYQGREFYIMNAGNKVFGGINRIQESSDGRLAEVEFSWGYNEVTPVGEIMGLMKSKPDLFKSSITFVRYEDGWKIKEGFDFNDLWRGLNEELKKYR
ncbi:MAG: zinc ribbon domain-containing protein [Bacteroidia bacterium]|nr:zinc ribbon domain-containing protein [Bacteroidia bacterium]